MPKKHKLIDLIIPALRELEGMISSVGGNIVIYERKIKIHKWAVKRWGQRYWDLETTIDRPASNICYGCSEKIGRGFDFCSNCLREIYSGELTKI